ncbi:MAG: Phosphoglycerate mutase family protein [Candidatus Woesebacteria bacterium GW2011_GWA1_37_8]|uniref:Phosphoglycerate mutase family protein n=2 Tax=Candidatus Woeseibacteriota TaxID=1752722 RepID=A0A0G0PDM7_9BACT|nr:MAG: Phosphoglycerate mutase family protein [Microgenomates group bacterium GW2011_GWC1_37_12b]KKQ43867.1 MAG: Phosphoglycerate mutase family protein [Candidatus Woesebacteria bacterium GW2011_GWA1_37_8]KKQ87391.1 MAG: Phosphoglycerate mutase family protein [Candidatus Woesebacteria bacterium GW2011_GWB1_38_8b]
MKVYIVRHGLSVDMANGIYQRPDSPLNGDGIKQANAAAVRFKDIPIDIIWSSPLRRSFETAQIINKIINKKLVLENLLEEEHRPSEIIGKEKTDIKSIEIVKKLNQNYGRIGYRYSDEDTFENLKTRASDILQKLIKQKYDSILLVTHGDISKMLLTTIFYQLKFPVSKYIQIQNLFSLSKGALSLLVFNPQIGWKIEFWNDKSHLEN